jgi:Plavaka transposase
MLARDIDCLMEIWAASNRNKNYSNPFVNHHMLYKSIDNISLGHVPWESFSTVYTGPKPLGIILKWMEQKYEVHFHDLHKIIHNMLSNPDFNGEFDYMHSRNLEIESISGEILCLEIWHRDKWYVAMKIIFNSNIWYYFKG